MQGISKVIFGYIVISYIYIYIYIYIIFWQCIKKKKKIYKNIIFYI